MSKSLRKKIALACAAIIPATSISYANVSTNESLVSATITTTTSAAIEIGKDTDTDSDSNHDIEVDTDGDSNHDIEIDNTDGDSNHDIDADNTDGDSNHDIEADNTDTDINQAIEEANNISEKTNTRISFNSDANTLLGLADGIYTSTIEVYNQYADADSMCKGFLPSEVQFIMMDGVATTTLYLAKNPELGGYTYNDTIGDVEYRDDNEEWILVEKTQTEAIIQGDEVEEAWEFEVISTDSEIYVRAVIGAMGGTNPAFRVILKEPIFVSELELDSELDSELDEELDDELDGELDNEVDNEVDDEVDDELDSELDDEVDEELDNEVDDELDSELDDEVDGELDNEVDDEVDSEVDDEVDGELDNEVDDEVDGELDGELDDEVDGEVDDELDGEVDGEVDDELDGELDGDTDDETDSDDEDGRVEITRLTLNKSNATLEVGKTYKLSADVYPANTTMNPTITWSSSDDNIASVDSKGTVTAVSEGTATITASSQSGITASATINVTSADTTDLVDGNYSAHINVWKEYVDEDSMAVAFFKTEDLNLQVSNGKLYLTIVVMNEGELGGYYYEPDIITKLEQQLNDGSYTTLGLNYQTTADGVEYITTTVEFDSIDDIAYVKTTIAPMNNIPQTLRILIDEASIQQGTSSNVPDVEAVSRYISSYTLENGAISLIMNTFDDTLTKDDFKATISLNGDATTTLELEDFTMDATFITFTYEEIEATDEEQELTVTMQVDDRIAISRTITIDAVDDEIIVDKELFSLKEGRISYIEGYGDNTFRPSNTITRTEALTMFGRLIDVPTQTYTAVDISVLNAFVDEDSMAAQFFHKERVRVEYNEDERYTITINVDNNGMGFEDILVSMEHKVDNDYIELNLNKSSDRSTATIVFDVDNLEDEVILRVGVEPMGDMRPELRIVFDTLEEFIETEAEAKLRVFETLKLTGSETINRADFAEMLVKIGQLELDEDIELKSKFLDVLNTDTYIIIATELGLVRGYGDGTFIPENKVTRAEAVCMINRLIEDSTDISDLELPFLDVARTHWAFEEIVRATN
ncbi:MAG: hypothetical protein BEN18_05615 [Epulopiscium sp. Nuni2H_MBin001]|nr:MAG: hypothetical protein BEN18_05615 [Epulopiscium sp. Nuni2H_MBin001]